jgi:hypothetical protein
MKYLLSFYWLLFTPCLLMAQTGFYRNLFGDFGANINGTNKLNSVHKISGDKHVVTTFETYLSNTFSINTFDTDFTPLWSAIYQGSPNNNSIFESCVELEDNRLISIGISGTTIFLTGHEGNGNLIFSRKYSNPSAQMFSTRAICASNENDTSFVALIAECAVKHGLIKFNKEGNVLWAYDYSFPGSYYANVYALDQAVNSGYISGGSNVGPAQDTIQHYGYLVVSNNDGTFKKGNKFQHISNNYNSVLAQRILTSSTNHYYVNFIYGNDYNGPWEYERNCIVAKLDSNLNSVNQWRFGMPNPNQSIAFDRMHETNDNKLLLTGNIHDGVNYPSTQYFIMKFNPNVPGGDIEWVKSFTPLINSQSYLSTIPNKALYTYGSNEQIIFAYSAHLDGSCISSIDQNGLGHCQAFDRTIEFQPVNDLIHFNFTSTPSQTPVLITDFPLLSAEVGYSDTVFCSQGGLMLPEPDDNMQLVQIKLDDNTITITNTCPEPIHFELYSSLGQIIGVLTLQPGESYPSSDINRGVYFFKASKDGIQQSGKIMW